jgi:hypothetical protein
VQITDTRISATYMTLLNTLANLGHMWLRSASLVVLDYLTIKESCAEGFVSLLSFQIFVFAFYSKYDFLFIRKMPRHHRWLLRVVVVLHRVRRRVLQICTVENYSSFAAHAKERMAVSDVICASPYTFELY